MTKEQRDQLEQRLLKERQRAVKALRQLDETISSPQGDGDLTTYPFHLADEGTDTIEQEQGMLLLSQEGRLLNDIDDALRTLYKKPDEYGICQSCQTEIVFERLDLVPWARHCVDCQQVEESRPETAAA